LEEVLLQLQASKEVIFAQQQQVAEQQEELAKERRSHALTVACEEQLTAAMQAAQQQLSKTKAIAQSDQQALQSMCAEVALLRAARQAAAKRPAATDAMNVYFKKQLASAQVQLQQQRQATAKAQVAARAKTFASAKLSAELNTVQAQGLRAELTGSHQQHQAAAASSPKASYPTDTLAQPFRRQHSSDEFGPGTPPRHSSWEEARAVVPQIGLESSSSSSNNSSRDTSSSGLSMGITSSSDDSKQHTVAARGSGVVASEVGAPVDACIGHPDDTDVSYDAQPVYCAVWV
jgi:hypothetical protein